MLHNPPINNISTFNPKMVESSQYYNIYNKEGRLIQVENGLQFLNTATPVVISRNKDCIAIATKKLYKSILLDETPTPVFRISSNIFCLITGMPGDIDILIHKLKEIYFEKEYEFGYPITPDILSRTIANKLQDLIQSTGERTFCFAMTLFGFDMEPMIYYVDLSAIAYPYFSIAMGEKSGKMNNFLEKNFNLNFDENELTENVTQTLMQSIGDDAGANEINVYVWKKNNEMKELNLDELDLLLQKIAEK